MVVDGSIKIELAFWDKGLVQTARVSWTGFADVGAGTCPKKVPTTSQKNETTSCGGKGGGEEKQNFSF